MQEEYDSSIIGPSQASVFRTSEQIRKDAIELIELNSAVTPKDIDVSVEGGIVTLRGRVDSDTARDAAERAVREVMGVIEIHNELEVAA